MKKLAALIDFTPTSELVVRFAANLAACCNFEVEFIHVSDSHDISIAKAHGEKLREFCSVVEKEGQPAKFEIHHGNFFSIISPIIKESNFDLILIGTHGKHGFMQNLFGSHILKLVQMTHCPSLVIQENSVWPAEGFKNILCPISSHDNFIVQLDQTSQLLSKDGELDIYAIHKTPELDDNSKFNINEGIKYLENKQIKHELREEDTSFYSVGYAKQTIEFLKENSYDMISIMSQISESGKYFGEMDKENIILNPMGIPVLCCDN